MAIPFIGSHISLTTKSGLRYEGTLQHINTEEHVVGLENGKSLPYSIFIRSGQIAAYRTCFFALKLTISVIEYPVRSFGIDGRLKPSNDIYSYILFRSHRPKNPAPSPHFHHDYHMTSECMSCSGADIREFAVLPSAESTHLHRPPADLPPTVPGKNPPSLQPTGPSPS
jgi:hypothetical protein